MSNRSSGIIDVHTTASYPTTAQVIFTFAPHFYVITAEGGAATSIVYSFDGINDAGTLTAGGNYSSGVMPMQGGARQKVWLKRGTNVGTESAQVVAWT
jgi:hypothetical protein